LNYLLAKVIIFPPKIKQQDRQHLAAFQRSILAKGGEGVVLRDKNALYAPGCIKVYKPHFEINVRVTKNDYPKRLKCEM
jgi:hypothetical protein